MSERTAKMMAITDIVMLPEIQIRIRVSEVQVQEYTEALKQDIDMDPIDVFVDKDGRNILSDGTHRLMAYVAADRGKIPAIVHEENPDDALSEALEFSMRRNCHHGLRMSNEDKRRAAGLALSDKILKKKSDRYLGQLCGISPALVKKIRENPARASEPRKKAAPKAKESSASTPAASTRVETTPASGSTTRAATPEPRGEDPVQERFRILKEWKEAGYIDWPVISNLFSNKKYIAVLQPKEIDGMILLEKGKIVGRMLVKSLSFIRKGDKNFVEVERNKAGNKSKNTDA